MTLHSLPALATCQQDTAYTQSLRTDGLYISCEFAHVFEMNAQRNQPKQCWTSTLFWRLHICNNKIKAASLTSTRNSPSTWANIQKIGYHSSFPGYTPSKQGTYIILDHMTSRDLFTNILPSNFFAIRFLEQFQCPSNAINKRFTAGTVHGNTHKCQTQMLGLPLHNVNPQLWKLDLHHFGWCDGHWNDPLSKILSIYPWWQIDIIQSALYMCGPHYTLRWCSR